MEQLDYYDNCMNHLGIESRDVVHSKGLWHKTIHCWLYDEAGNIYFQLRTDSGKMYTTASGHVNAGESLKQAFARECREEIGIDVDMDTAELVMMTVWRLDKKRDGVVVWQDRAFAHIYVNKIPTDFLNFKFDPTEVTALIKINISDALKILRSESGSCTATKICHNNTIEPITITLADFHINNGEIGMVKFGRILQHCTQEIFTM